MLAGAAPERRSRRLTESRPFLPYSGTGAGRHSLAMPVLSIVIPAYNEGAFIGTLLERIIAVPTERLGFEKEIIVVDDGSSDNTGQVARSFANVRCFTQVPNQGK